MVTPEPRVDWTIITWPLSAFPCLVRQLLSLPGLVGKPLLPVLCRLADDLPLLENIAPSS